MHRILKSVSYHITEHHCYHLLHFDNHFKRGRGWRCGARKAVIDKTSLVSFYSLRVIDALSWEVTLYKGFCLPSEKESSLKGIIFSLRIFFPLRV